MGATVFSYVAYGLGIRSALALPELVKAKGIEGTEDVTVRLGHFDPGDLVPVAEGALARATREEGCSYYEGVGGFLVRGGREIIVDPAPGVEERVLRLFLLGPVFALLLHQQGRMVLHASAVAVDAGVVAFLGDSGLGKSSIAAAMNSRGHPLVSDDVTAVELRTRSAVVLPGFPQIKLWPDAAVALGMAPESMPRLHPDYEKRARRITGEFPKNPLPFRRIYVLDEAGQPELESLRPSEVFLELVRNSWRIRLLHPLIASSHFRQCGELANRVAACRLRTTGSLPALPDLARLVEEDVSRDGFTGSHAPCGVGDPSLPGTFCSGSGSD